MNKEVIGASFTVSAYEMMNIPTQQIKEFVRSRMAYQLAETLIESEKFVITEKAGINMGQPDKTFEVKLVVMSLEEQRELLKYKEHFESLNPMNKNF